MSNIPDLIIYLENNGMIFENHKMTNLYLTYQNAYCLLKRHKNIFFNLEHTNKESDLVKYHSLYFNDLILAAKINFELAELFKIYSDTIEHHIKVYMNQIYSGLSAYKQENIESQYKIVTRGSGDVTKFKFLPHSTMNLNCFFDVFHFATLSELIQIFQITFSPLLETPSKLYINTCDPKKRQHILKNSIVHPRNQSAHHNLLLVHEDSEKQKVPNKTLNHFIDSLEYDIPLPLKYLLSTNRLHFNLIFNLNTCYSLLSQHASQNARKKHFYRDIQKHNLAIQISLSQLTHCDPWIAELHEFYNFYIKIIDNMAKDV